MVSAGVVAILRVLPACWCRGCWPCCWRHCRTTATTTTTTTVAHHLLLLLLRPCVRKRGRIEPTLVAGQRGSSATDARQEAETVVGERRAFLARQTTVEDRERTDATSQGVQRALGLRRIQRDFGGFPLYYGCLLYTSPSPRDRG